MLVHPNFDPVALQLGPIAVRWYGLMYLLAFVLFVWLGKLRARRNLLRLAGEPPRLPRQLEETLAALLATTEGSATADLGRGLRAVREYDEVALERGPVRFGPWRIETEREGLKVRTWRPGDRLAGRTKKIQDVFVDAKIPRSQRHEWPLVVERDSDEVVAVPGLVEAPGVKAVRE